MKDELLFSYRDEELYIKHARSCEPEPGNFPFLSHCHNMYEIYYFLQGSGDFTVEGNTYSLKRGTLLFTGKGQSHNIHIHFGTGPYERFVIMLGEKQIPQSILPVLQTLVEEEKNRFMLKENDRVWLESCLQMLCRAENYGMSMRETVSSVIQLLILKLCEHTRTGYQEMWVEDDMVRQIIRYANTHLTEDWNLDTLENALYRNKAYLNRKFKSVMGCSIWEYVMRKRVFCAQQELYLSKSVTAAFETSGFNDYSAFYRKYVKYIGCSPSEDLKRYLG